MDLLDLETCSTKALQHKKTKWRWSVFPLQMHVTVFILCRTASDPNSIVSFSFVYIVIMCCMWQNFGYPLNQLCCHGLGVAIVRIYKLDHQTKSIQL